MEFTGVVPKRQLTCQLRVSVVIFTTKVNERLSACQGKSRNAGFGSTSDEESTGRIALLLGRLAGLTSWRYD